MAKQTGLTRFFLLGAALVIAGISIASAKSSQRAGETNALDVGNRSSDTQPEFIAGKTAFDKGDLETARLHLYKVVQFAPNRFDAVELLTQANIRRARDLAGRNEHLQAGNLLREAQVVAAKAENDAPLGSDAPSRRVLVDCDHQLSAATAELRISAENFAEANITQADWHADNAYRYVRKNNRDEVRIGLRHLHDVYERFDLLGNWWQSRYHLSMNRLKSLVSDPEWAPLRAEAGFIEKSPL